MAFNLKQFLGVLTAVAPIVFLAVPGGAALAPFVPLIVKGIADAQAQPGATGVEKKAFVLALVKDAADTTAQLNPHLIDPALTVAAAGQAVDAVITTVNAIQTAHAALPDVPAAIVLG